MEFSFHTPEPAEKCPVGTFWGTTHPEVLPDTDIWVENAETVEEGEPERTGWLEPEEGKGTELEEEKGVEPKEKGREESEERRGNPATLRSLEGDLETPPETGGRHNRSRHVPGGAWLAQVRLCFRVNFLPGWIRSGIERGTQGRDREEGIGKKERLTECILTFNSRGGDWDFGSREEVTLLRCNSETAVDSGGVDCRAGARLPKGPRDQGERDTQLW
ncbi:hypothetical protein NDU88_004791 [Pleurodeles waltl]|uniref:Uncharacterized protein n=1 Tax=Pleurodeles waltl TaxID=8319 RepID=A0AAV7WWI3_PLEWA|nr:hypothetical protein NDU88_004791 [Pleurodeles waltl]